MSDLWRRLTAFFGPEEWHVYPGLLAVSYGAWMAWEPAGWIVLGGVGLYIGLFHGAVTVRLKRRPSEDR